MLTLAKQARRRSEAQVRVLAGSSIDAVIHGTDPVLATAHV